MIKQIYTILLLSFVLTAVHAQERSFDSSPVLTKSSTHLKAQKDASRAVIDTVEVFFPTWNDDCSIDLLSFFPMGAWGRVSGMNEFLDQQKAQQLELVGTDAFRVLGGIGYFSWASSVGNGNLRMNFYSVDFDSNGPGELLASSADLTVEDIVLPDTFISVTIFVIPQADQPTLTDPQFFASVDFSDLYATGDSVALLQTDEECGDGKNTWEQIINGEDTSWVNIFDSWNGLNADFAITAIVEFDPLASSEEFVISNGITLYPAFPNPAGESIVLSFELENTSKVSIDVLDNLGKRVYRSDKQSMRAGKNLFEMSLQPFSPGSYYYVINTEHGTIASRFVMQ